MSEGVATLAPPASVLAQSAIGTRPASGLAAIVIRRFTRHRLALPSLGVLALMILSAALAPLSRYAPTEQSLRDDLLPPSAAHWFGTDDLGRDVFTRTLYGGRISLIVGLAATALSLAIGLLVGALAGHFGGWLDNVLMRVTDVFLSFPTLFVLILIGTMLRDLPLPGLRNSVVVVVLVIAVLSWMWPARLLRGSFLALREREFIVATRALGASDWRIIFHHGLPNSLGLLIVHGTLETAFAIIAESGLSYLGFGVQPPTPSWGNLLAEAQTYALRAPWLAVFPGVMIFVTVLAINAVGDALRDALDPHVTR